MAEVGKEKSGRECRLLGLSGMSRTLSKQSYDPPELISAIIFWPASEGFMEVYHAFGLSESDPPMHVMGRIVFKQGIRRHFHAAALKGPKLDGIHQLPCQALPPGGRANVQSLQEADR